MAKTMEIQITIKDENGESIVTSKSERVVPYIEEIETQGFRRAFHELETAVLESRKEVSESAVTEYLEAISQKKRSANPALEMSSQEKRTVSQAN